MESEPEQAELVSADPKAAGLRLTRFLASAFAVIFVPWTFIALYVEYDGSYLAGLAPNLFGAGGGVLSAFGLVLVLVSIRTTGKATRILIGFGATISLLANALLIWFSLEHILMRWGWKTTDVSMYPDSNEQIALATVVVAVALLITLAWYVQILIRIRRIG